MGKVVVPDVGTHLASLNLFRNADGSLNITVSASSVAVMQEIDKARFSGRPIDYIDRLIIAAADNNAKCLGIPTGAYVLKYLDYFAGQENTADEVRDFVQKAARFIDEQRPMSEWLVEDDLAMFIEWLHDEAQPK